METKRLLGSFIEDSKQLHTYLEKFYHLYCGIILDSGFRKYEFKFLGNLGLNYLYWFNEDYLKAVYGDNWEIEYKKCSDNFDFYHRQLTPICKRYFKCNKYRANNYTERWKIFYFRRN